VSAKGDGRYVISNGKDQAMRLWDLRKMRSSYEFEQVESRHYGVHSFDYRFAIIPRSSVDESKTELLTDIRITPGRNMMPTRRTAVL